MKLRTVLLFGAPGSGKGTQGKVLGALPGFYHCSCGEVFRSLKLDTPLGRVFVEYSSRGELVPDGPTIELWRQFIGNCRQGGHYDPANDILVLDGIPRNLAQAELLRDTLDVRAVVYLTCPHPEKLVQRLQRRALKENRLDDANLETIRRRLETYDQESRPVLDFYGRELLHEVDATQTPLDVLEDVVAVIRRITAG
ncbi:MAG: nucleoside monophosphate kinase [Verrucomicrobiales bacterium]|nr:nucleoside monophosphate kinase [Verrucomicrobiales bacterium]